VSDARVVLTTCADAPGAEALARTLVDERLARVRQPRAACPLDLSLAGGDRGVDEILCVIKTTQKMAGAVTKRIQELSGYNVRKRWS
jgi:uncharacterized protein involved in tolerance to divalent cations